MQLSPLDCLKNPVQAPPPKLLDAIPGLGTHSKLSPSLPSCFQSGLLHFSIQIILLPECPAAPEGIVYPKKGPYIQETPPTHPPLQGGTRVPNPPSLLISGSSERCCWQPPSLKKNTQEYRLQGILDGPVLSQSRDNSEHRASACQGWNKSTAGGPQVSPINPQPEIPNPL